MDNEEILKSIKDGLEKAAKEYMFESNQEQAAFDVVDENIVVDEITEDGEFFEIKCEAPTINTFDKNSGKFMGAYKAIKIYRYKYIYDAIKRFKSLCSLCNVSYNISLERSYRVTTVTVECNIKNKEGKL